MGCKREKNFSNKGKAMNAFTIHSQLNNLIIYILLLLPRKLKKMLEVTHERTSQVKEVKSMMLMNDYKNF